MRKPSPPCFAVFTEMTPASNVVVRFWAHGMSDCQRLCRGETKHGLVHDVSYQNSLTLPITSPDIKQVILGFLTMVKRIKRSKNVSVSTT